MQKNITIQEIDEVVAAILSKVDTKPRIGMILGSGLSDFAETIENAVSSLPTAVAATSPTLARIIHGRPGNGLASMA